MKALISKFSKREQSVFVLTVSVIFIILIYIFMIKPAREKWDALQSEVKSADARLLKDIKLLADKDLLEKEYQRYKEYIQKDGPHDQDLSPVLKEIEDNAVACGVKITSIKPKGERKLKNYNKFNVEVICEGRINQLVKFIYDLEGSKKLLKVERLVLTLKGSQSDLLKGTLLIRKISFPE